MPLTERLFAYGTLRPGCGRSLSQMLATSADYLGPGRLPGRLYDLRVYPGAVFDAAARSWIAGDVFALHRPATWLRVLDAYEEFDSNAPGRGEFRRELLPIDLEGRSRRCWVYLYNRPVDSLTPIPGGDYLRARFAPAQTRPVREGPHVHHA